MGLQSQGSKEKICKYYIKQRKEAVPKKTRKIISHIPDCFTVAVVEDESIFVHDALI